MISAALRMGFDVMDQSIEKLDSWCQEKLDLACKENQYHPKMDIQDIVSAWIKKSRLDAGLTGEQLGERIGVSKQNVSHWETGKHDPSVCQIVKIGEICKAKLPRELSTESQLSDESLRFALSYQALPQQFRKQILDALTTAEIAAKSLGHL